MATSRVRKLAAGGIALGGTVAIASWIFGDDNHTKVNKLYKRATNISISTTKFHCKD